MLAWRLANTLTPDVCTEAVQEVLVSYGKPDIVNMDHGCQFTSQEFTGLLKDHDIQISMDGTGCWRDNVFGERRWQSVKYEEVYVRAYDRISAAPQSVGRYLTFYNQTSPHRVVDGKTPEEVYGDNLAARLTAAYSDHCEAPLKEWIMLSNQLEPPLNRRHGLFATLRPWPSCIQEPCVSPFK